MKNKKYTLDSVRITSSGVITINGVVVTGCKKLIYTHDADNEPPTLELHMLALDTEITGGGIEVSETVEARDENTV